ncbi:MAG: class I SAM-dependent methyltransferase [Patescibacteria group bacterium]|nr:class I SAM-dependent methyltransferase [Patescibacteria group bacterium]
MNISVIEFFVSEVNPKEFSNKKVLEVGSRYINGSIRPIVERLLNPKEYIGIDIQPGKFVDIILPAENLVDRFGKNAFDVIIALELLEHVKDYKLVIENMKEVLRPNGFVYISTRSYGFPYHGYPYDFWRYEINDMENLFADFEVIALKNDPEAKGVFLKAKKPQNYKKVDISDYKLYSILLGKRTDKIVKEKDCSLFRRLLINTIYQNENPTILFRVLRKIFKLI